MLAPRNKDRLLRLAAATAALAWCTPAYAHSEAVVLGVLVYFGLGGGLVAGPIAVVAKRAKLSFAWPFAAFLGILSVFAAVWSRSIEVIPYAIAYGAFVSVLPFVISYYLSRFVAQRINQAISARSRGLP
ncbi:MULTISPECIES: hypothetical protein [Roseateles]|uniref:hypothetical protein n=1 Tax=Roseateles TaxID=93681 RepID=UPI001057050A|nr:MULTISPECIES: hypothetical protein [Roseateles]